MNKTITNKGTYDFNQHKHNYAVWTAARAVQRGFTTTAVIKSVIEKTNLRKYAEETISDNSFEDFHRQCANQIIIHFKEESGLECSYGKASKIIAIYLKTSVILCNKGACDFSKQIHPPIDSILLRQLSTLDRESGFHTIRWTKLNEEAYWNLVADLKKRFRRFDWTLEEHWSPERD